MHGQGNIVILCNKLFSFCCCCCWSLNKALMNPLMSLHPPDRAEYPGPPSLLTAFQLGWLVHVPPVSCSSGVTFAFTGYSSIGCAAFVLDNTQWDRNVELLQGCRWGKSVLWLSLWKLKSLPAISAVNLRGCADIFTWNVRENKPWWSLCHSHLWIVFYFVWFLFTSFKS